MALTLGKLALTERASLAAWWKSMCPTASSKSQEPGLRLPCSRLEEAGLGWESFSLKLASLSLLLSSRWLRGIMSSSLTPKVTPLERLCSTLEPSSSARQLHREAL